LLRGDLRPLYLGWLAAASAVEIDEDVLEPPPPFGLSRLTAAQRSLVEFLEIDQDLLAAAAFGDKPAHVAIDESRMDDWIADLPDSERRKIIKLLMTGHSLEAERQLKSRFIAWQKERRVDAEPNLTRRTVASLWELAKSAAETRKQRESAQRSTAEAQRQAKRESYLRTLADDFDRHWNTADEYAGRATASAYNDAKRILVDLADA
jgi:DNA primase catalytic subunit